MWQYLNMDAKISLISIHVKGLNILLFVKPLYSKHKLSRIEDG